MPDPDFHADEDDTSRHLDGFSAVILTALTGLPDETWIHVRDLAHRIATPQTPDPQQSRPADSPVRARDVRNRLDKTFALAPSGSTRTVSGQWYHVGQLRQAVISTAVDAYRRGATFRRLATTEQGPITNCYATHRETLPDPTTNTARFTSGAG